MQVKALGCHGGELDRCRSSGFLINGSVLLDAGTTCAALTLPELRKIRAILISHLHSDHTQGLLSLAENLLAQGTEKPVLIAGIEKVLIGLRRHFFNNVFCPDFTALPTKQHPVFSFKTLREGEETRLSSLTVRALEVHHTVPCTGFLVREKDTTLLYSGDTGPTTRLWEAASRDTHLKAAMIEVSFPDALESLANESRHLTPRLMAREFAKIGNPDLQLYAYHMKPFHLTQIKKDIRKLKMDRLTILREGDCFEV
jgi:3',5'-cyclic-nucleotide phosphodiesterase